MAESVVIISKIINDTPYDINVYHKQTKNIEFIGSNDGVSNLALAFPWVVNQNDFRERALVVEALGKTRFYLWDQNWKLYCYKSNKYLDSPFNSNTFIRMDGDEWLRGKLIPGDYNKSKLFVELVFGMKNDQVTVYSNNL